jgi:hypothetical protein
MNHELRKSPNRSLALRGVLRVGTCAFVGYAFAVAALSPSQSMRAGVVAPG